MEGNVRDGNQQRMAKRSKQLLLRAESVRRGGTAGEGRGGGCRGLGESQLMGWGPKKLAGMSVPLRTMGTVRWRRKRGTVVLLHCSICGAYLNSGLRLELESKMCFMSKFLA